MNIFERLKTGELVQLNDPEFYKVNEIVNRTLALTPKLNASTNSADIRICLSDIMNRQVDETTTLFAPFYTNFGQFINLGKHVFINHDCSFLDMGGITLEDQVLIGPKVSLITENHPLDAANRRGLICSPIWIKRNAWIGAGATVLPGVTIGENAIVAAGSVVTRDVDANTIVAGVPAKMVKVI